MNRDPCKIYVKIPIENNKDLLRRYCLGHTFLVLRNMVLLSRVNLSYLRLNISVKIHF